MHCCYRYIVTVLDLFTGAYGGACVCSSIVSTSRPVSPVGLRPHPACIILSDRHVLKQSSPGEVSLNNHAKYGMAMATRAPMSTDRSPASSAFRVLPVH